MIDLMYQIYLWCIPIVALLAFAGSVSGWRITDMDLFKANAAVMGHSVFLKLWYIFVRPEEALGQPWLMICITLTITAWIITRRPASLMSAILAGIITAGIAIIGVCGLTMIWVGYIERLDWVIWYSVFTMASLNLVILAGWSFGNIGRTIRNYTAGSRADLATHSRSSGGKR